jgi:hypothetical protein
VALTDAEVERLRAAARFRMHRQHLQSEQAKPLAEALPLSQLHLPFLFTTELGEAEIGALALALTHDLATLPEPAPADAGSP